MGRLSDFDMCMSPGSIIFTYNGQNIGVFVQYGFSESGEEAMQLNQNNNNNIKNGSCIKPSLY